MTITAPRTRAATRTAATLLGHLILLAAIPAALWYLWGNPIPHTLPSWDDIQEYWRGIQAEPSQIVYPLLTVLADVLWIAWAWYGLWFALALTWTLLRLPAAIVPNALAVITPAIAVRAISLGALVATPTITPHPVHTVTSTASPLPTRPIRAASTNPNNTPDPVVHTVVPGDNLWDLARHYYRDPEAWHRIFTANQGVTQPDGRSLQDPALILPGWRLTIPGIPAPGGTPSPHPDTATGHTATAPAPGPATAPPAPSRTPGSPGTHPGATGPHTAARTPATPGPARTDRPHTVGYHLPAAAGYTSITLITAIGAAVALLRTRNRHRGLPRDHEVPDLARTLAAVHSAAVSADHYGYRPDEHPGETPPPLLADPPDHPVLGTTEDQQHETAYDPDQLPGPLALTGPGATAAARALAISTLATEGHTLSTDPDLTGELLGTPHAPDHPGWRTSTPQNDETAGNRAQQPTATTAIRTPKPGAGYPPGTVLLGHPETNDATVLDIETDGTVRSASGNGADQYTGTHLNTLTRDAAAELYTTLEEARPAPSAEPDQDQAESETAEHTAHPGQDEHTAAPTAADPRALTTTPLILRVLGEPDVLGPTGAPTPIATEQATALLTILALHPDGIRARELLALEWPHTTDNRTARMTLSKAITRIRAYLRNALPETPEPADPVPYDNTAQTYRLNPAMITTDLALTRHLTHYAETAEQEQKLTLLTQAATLYRGQLSPWLDDHHRDWLTTARYAVLKEAAALHLRAADLAADTDPQAAAHHLRQLADLTPEDHDTATAALRICQRLKDPRLANHLYQRHRDALRGVKENPDPAITQLARAIRDQ